MIKLTQNTNVKERDNLKTKINSLRTESSVYTKKISDLEYVRTIINEEIRQPEFKVWIEQGLVHKKDNFDDWYNNFFVRTKGFKKGYWDREYAKKLFAAGGIQGFDRHIERLFIARDARLKNTIIYEKYKDRFDIKTFDVDISKHTKESIQTEINTLKDKKRKILDRYYDYLERKKELEVLIKESKLR